jgi:hypothetical protein
MPSNLYRELKTKGAGPGTTPNSGGANPITVPLLGVVKSNIDANRSGMIYVYLSNMSGPNPENSKSWTPIRYMSPFFGHTTGSPPNTGYGGYVENSASYGMWTSPPDVGSTVICMFVNGDINEGYCVGCVPSPQKLFMVPAIGAAEANVVLNPGEAKSFGGATRLPVININTNDNKIGSAANFYDQPKPVHSYAAAVFAQQGLLRDPVRGPIGSSAQRESPSRVGFGVSTPGRPIYAGGYTDQTITQNLDNANANKTQVISRRSGHTLVMDDGDINGRDQLIRLRTSLGHQILMSDDGQTLFIIHANGQSYIELGKEGTIDMYSTNSVNIRTQGDLNLHADNNININADKDLNIKGKNIKMESVEDTTQRVGVNYSMHAIGEYAVKVNGQIALSSLVTSSLSSLGATFINGIGVFLNTGKSPVSPKEVKPIIVKAHTDTLNDATKGWLPAPGLLTSIVSRAPAHAPWADANLGVPVFVNSTAAANLPSAPSAPIADANARASGKPSTIPSPAVQSTVPLTPGISPNVGPGLTGALAGLAADQAARNPVTKDATAVGGGVVNTEQGKRASIGVLAQTPEQLEAAGILKPGSAALINGLIARGYTMEQAITPNLFTGKVGADSLGAYANNLTAQVDTQVEGFRIAQSNLIKSGLITGKEAGVQLAAPIYSAAMSGVKQTIGFIQNSTLGPVTAITTGISTGITAATTAAVGAASALTTRTISSVTDFLGGKSPTGDAISIAGDPSKLALPGFTVGDSLSKVNIGDISSNFGATFGVSVNQGVTNATTTLTGAFDSLSNKAQEGLDKVASQFDAANATAQAENLVTGAITKFVTGQITKITAKLDFVGQQLLAALDRVKGAAAGAYEKIVAALPDLKPGVPLNLKQETDNAIAKANGVGAGAADAVKNQQAGSPDASGVASGDASSAFNPLAQFQNAGNTIYNNIKDRISPAIDTIEGIGKNINTFTDRVNSPNGTASLTDSAKINEIVTNLGNNIADTVQSQPGVKRFLGALGAVDKVIDYLKKSSSGLGGLVPPRAKEAVDAAATGSVQSSKTAANTFAATDEQVYSLSQFTIGNLLVQLPIPNDTTKVVDKQTSNEVAIRQFDATLTKAAEINNQIAALQQEYARLETETNTGVFSFLSPYYIARQQNEITRKIDALKQQKAALYNNNA